jgi:transposase
MKQQTSAATETGLKGKNKIDFSGKTIFVGIDVHQKDWQVAIICDGLVLGNHRMSGKAENVIEHLNKRYSGATFKCVYESSAWGFNLQRKLTAASIDCIVVHAADVSGSDKEQKRKTDQVDAVKLARHHASGMLEGIHVPEPELQKERNLIRFRKNLVNDLTRSRNRIKSILKYQGIDIPEQFGKAHWSYNFMDWVEQEAKKDLVQGQTLLLMLEQVKSLRQLLLKTERTLRSLMSSRKYKDKMQLLMSVPGIGPTISALWLLEIGDVKRFQTFDQLNDFVGLCPDTDDSGDTHRTKGISSRRHKQLRTAMVEAAWQAIRRDPAMFDSYRKLTSRMRPNQAIVRIAKKLLRRIRMVMITGTPYEKGVVGLQNVTAKTSNTKMSFLSHTDNDCIKMA